MYLLLFSAWGWKGGTDGGGEGGGGGGGAQRRVGGCII